MLTLDESPATADDLQPLALTNFGHFTSMRVSEDGSVRGLSLHLERLARDSKSVFGVTVDTERVRDNVRRAVGEAGCPCTIRVTVYDPAVDMGHPVDAKTPRALVSVRPAGDIPAAPLSAMSVMYERDLPEVKHVGLFGPLHARRAAQQAGFDDALFVGRDGHVSEGVTWNVAFIDGDGTVVWPQAPVLPGITMALLQQHGAGIEHRTAPVILDQAKDMAAAFATNTSVGVRPLSRLDDKELPTKHPVLDALTASYLSIPGEVL
ncbi:aminotransferase class IV family protein [Streptomyces sp. NPDC056296]|uniref:aminotransferase class IV family protein n=1 Tax=Streptomyces sp. NPDC056296 TaxID=3345775 RepID=UPI0035D9C06C